MDVNTVLLWLTGAVCVTLIGRFVLARNRGAISWAVVVAGVIAVSGACFWRQPQIAGFVGAGLCLVFVLTPLHANLWAYRLAGRRRYAAARALGRLAVALHPSSGMRQSLGFLAAMESARSGAAELAAPAAGDLDTALGRFAHVEALRAHGQFAELLAFTRALPRSVVLSEPVMAFHLLRALAEQDEIESLLAEYAELERAPALAGALAQMQLVVATRLGRVDLVDRLLAGPAGVGMAAGVAEGWRATALHMAGSPAARAALEQLSTHPDPDVRHAVQRRLATRSLVVEIEKLSPEAQRVAQELAHEIESARGFDARSRRAPATTAIALILIGVFVIEELRGGSTDLDNLVALGALVIPPMWGADSVFRVLSAAFLHLGTLHLVMNLLGLWALGRQLESALGALRTVLVFLVSALVGNAVARYTLAGPAVLVGASGGVLGLLGGLLAIAARRHFVRRTRFLRRQLAEMAFVVALQAVFDFMTPQVSSIVHATGFAAGLSLTLALVWKQARAAPT